MTTRIFLIAHAPLAHALRECALHVFPDCWQEVLALDAPPHEAPEATLSAARALLEHTELPADQVVKKALEIAGELCIYTNMHHTIETL